MTRFPEYENCRLCPRECGVNRYETTGFCREGAEIRLGVACLHFGEEPPVTGKGGSGTIFFTGCTLRCNFCQNYQISQEGMGRAVNVEALCDIMLSLQKAGAENINLVSGTAFAPSIIAAAKLARGKDLSLPILWNGSGYETDLTVEALSEVVNVWLPDFKTPSPETARKYFAAPDYPERAEASILLAAKRAPLVIKAKKIRRGLIMRHLVLPGALDETEKILAWFADNLQGKALLSLMTQYTPIPALREREAPADALSQAEYDRLMKLLERYDFEGSFYQELVPGSDWLPDFSRHNPFSSELARTIWHWGS
jgi:putative pyruvate formate lyase activating enzyme